MTSAKHRPHRDERDDLVRFAQRIADDLSEDSRIDAVWLGGSLGRGEGDALSDVDLIVIAKPGQSGEVASYVRTSLSVAGRVALVHDAPHNAPKDGGQFNVLYDRDPLPLYVDWTVWPSVDVRPRDARVLFERRPLEEDPDVTLGTMSERFEPGKAPGLTPLVLARFRLFMAPVLVKHAARGWFDSVEGMLASLRMPARPLTSLREAIALARELVRQSAMVEDPRAIECIERYFALVERRS
jgi:predicted nucleotidyltransferase